MRLWDSLLADGSRFDLLIYFAAAMVLSIRQPLIEHNDFAFSVKALQHFDNRVPLHELLRRATEMQEEDQAGAAAAPAAGGGAAPSP